MISNRARQTMLNHRIAVTPSPAQPGLAAMLRITSPTAEALWLREWRLLQALFNAKAHL